MMSRITLNLMRSHDEHLHELMNPANSRTHYQGFLDSPLRSRFPTLTSPPTSKGKDRDRWRSISHIEFADYSPTANNEAGTIAFHPHPQYVSGYCNDSNAEEFEYGEAL